MQYIKAILLFSICILEPYCLFAQETTLTAGKDFASSNGNFSFSIGQVVYTSNANSSGSVEQGVQQTYLISILEETQKNISIYPNPTRDFLNLKIENDTLNEYSYKLFDLKGKLLLENQVQSEISQIPMTAFPKSSYSLCVTKGEELIQSFKLTKH